MKFKLPISVLALVTYTSIAFSAHAGVIWGPLNTITASSDISLDGTYVDAAGNFGGGGGTVDVNGTMVVFHGLTLNGSNNTYSDGSHITLSNIVSDAGGDSYTGSNPVSVDYAGVMAGTAYTGNGSGQETGTVQLSGLISGDKYLIEVWQARDGDATRDTIFGSVGGLDSAQTTGGNYLIGTFTANSSLIQDFTFRGQTGELNTLQLRDLGPASTPEPSTFSLMIGGLGGLVILVLRRRDRLT